MSRVTPEGKVHIGERREASQRRLEPLLSEGRKQAEITDRPVVVCSIEPLPELDPLTVLATLMNEPISRNAIGEGASVNAMYWAHPRERFALAAFGSAATLEAKGGDRFRAIEAEWATLLDGAVIDAPAADAPAGPVLLGGFSFDPNGPNTGLWTGFPSAQMVLPRVLVTARDGKCWLTLSAVVGAATQTGSEAATMELLREIVRSPVSRAGGDMDEFVVSESVDYADLLSPSQWRGAVRLAVDEIRGGRLSKVVLARAVRAAAPAEIDVFQVIRSLRGEHTGSFVFGCWRGETAFVGASPERLVRLDGRRVRASSLAGTASRGSTPQEDAGNAEMLLASAKDRDEHAAVRNSLHDALADICDDVRADEVPSILTLPHLHHLHTPVEATLREGHTLLQVAGRLHPTPAVGGSPRDAALRFIRKHEHLDRGWYAAPVGWIGGQSGEFAVGLRSAVIRGDQATLFAGCGIVADSDPELEYAESVLKLRPMQSAIAVSLTLVVEESNELVTESEQRS